MLLYYLTGDSNAQAVEFMFKDTKIPGSIPGYTPNAESAAPHQAGFERSQGVDTQGLVTRYYSPVATRPFPHWKKPPSHFISHCGSNQNFKSCSLAFVS